MYQLLHRIYPQALILVWMSLGQEVIDIKKTISGDRSVVLPMIGIDTWHHIKHLTRGHLTICILQLCTICSNCIYVCNNCIQQHWCPLLILWSYPVMEMGLVLLRVETVSMVVKSTGCRARLLGFNQSIFPA